MQTQYNQLEQQPNTSIEKKLLALLFVTAMLPTTILLAAVGTGMFQFQAIIAAVICQAIGLAMGYFLGYEIIRQSYSIKATLAKINNGDFEARTQLITSDELGQSAVAINAICDNTLNLIQSSDEQVQIQNSIENLILEMQGIAEGDLTIATEVRDDMTGSIAESVNKMSQQLRSIVEKVQSAAEQVTSLSARIRESSTLMSNESDTQANRIGAASQQLLEMTDSFQSVAESTTESVQVAIEARQTAANGLKAVADTMEGMQRIRTQVQNTSKRIKRFGESSQEIGEIVQMISDIADQTSILALNASIQASMAGDAGQGFAVVAEEIERLAERSTEATNQISKLIRGIQNETSEVISDMEESTREVVTGSQLASQAGTTLFEINSVSNQLVELIQDSSESALQQAAVAANIASAMSEIALTTKESAEKSRVATQSVGQLTDMVIHLRTSVSQFKVADQSTKSVSPLDPSILTSATSHASSSSGTATSVALPVEPKNEPNKTDLPFLAKRKKTSARIKQSDEALKQTAPSSTENNVVTNTMVMKEPAANSEEIAIDEDLVRELRKAQRQMTSNRQAANVDDGVKKKKPSQENQKVVQASRNQQSAAVQNPRPADPAVQKQRIVQRTSIASDSKPTSDDETATEKSIDEKLLRQLREATALLEREKPNTADDSTKSQTSESANVKQSNPKTMLLDNE